jgi:hypothetical protein
MRALVAAVAVCALVPLRADAGPCQDRCAQTKINCLNAKLASCSDAGCKAMIGDYDHRVCNPPFEACMQGCRPGPGSGPGSAGAGPAAPGAGVPGLLLDPGAGAGQETVSPPDPEDESAADAERQRRERQFQQAEESRIKTQLEALRSSYAALLERLRAAGGTHPREFVPEIVFPGDPPPDEGASGGEKPRFVVEKLKLPGEDCPLPSGPYGSVTFIASCAGVELSIGLDLIEAVVPGLSDDGSHVRARNTDTVQHGVFFKFTAVSSAGGQYESEMFSPVGAGATWDVPQWYRTPFAGADLGDWCPQRIVAFGITDLRVSTWPDPMPADVYTRPKFTACPGGSFRIR